MEIYKALRKVAVKYYPKEDGFCTVIALAVHTGWSFGKARSVMYKEHGRVDGKGSTIRALNDAFIKYGFKVTMVSLGPYGKTLRTIQRDLAAQGGNYLVYTRGHVVAVKEGSCEDWSNNLLRPSSHPVEFLYELERIT